MRTHRFLKKYLLAATATAALLFSACDLDEHPTSFRRSQGLLQDPGAVSGGTERLLHPDQQHLRLLLPDHDRRRHRLDVHHLGNQGRPARHIARKTAQRREDMDPVLQGRDVLQFDHRRHRALAPERHRGGVGGRQAAAAGGRHGAPLVLLLAADLRIRRRSLLHQRGSGQQRDDGDRPPGPHAGEGYPRLPDRRIETLRALHGSGCVRRRWRTTAWAPRWAG